MRTPGKMPGARGVVTGSSLGSDGLLFTPAPRKLPARPTDADAVLTADHDEGLSPLYGAPLGFKVPVLIDDTRGEHGNPWGIKFTTMFHMANDSGLFRTAAQLFAEGTQPRGANWVRPHGETWVPLYEAKMIHQYDHRWATYEDDGKTSRNATQSDKADPHYQVQPRYWVAEQAVEQRLRDKGWTREWLIGWRDICRSTDQRTVISGVFPKAAYGDKFLLMMLKISPRYIAALLGNLNALCLDFIARQKLGGTSLKYFTMKQMTILPPTHFTEVDLDFIVTMTAHPYRFRTSLRETKHFMKGPA